VLTNGTTAYSTRSRLNSITKGPSQKGMFSANKATSGGKSDGRGDRDASMVPGAGGNGNSNGNSSSSDKAATVIDIRHREWTEIIHILVAISVFAILLVTEAYFQRDPFEFNAQLLLFKDLVIIMFQLSMLTLFPQEAKTETKLILVSIDLVPFLFNLVLVFV
jgi:hypothetical protein